MDNYFNIPPPPKLSHFVKCFWAVEGDGATEFIHRSVALGLPYMVFHYKGVFDEIKDNTRIKYPLTHFQGQTRKFRLFAINESFGLFGANFYPHIIPHLLKTSSESITDKVSDFESLLGADARELEEKIMLAATNFERVKIISSFLEKKLLNGKKNRDVAIQEAIRHVINSPHSQSVAQLAHAYNLSKRQFERKFKEYSGFSPKLFSRIARFHRAYDQCSTKNLTFSEIAHSCGYYDQAHFNHDFKMFSGIQPGQKIWS